MPLVQRWVLAALRKRQFSSLAEPNEAMVRRLKKSKLNPETCGEGIHYRYPRQMVSALIRSLTSSQWVLQQLCLLFTGPTGMGKSWLAQGRADGSLGKLLESMARTDLLVVEDFAMAPLLEQERRDFLEICADRYGRPATVLTSPLPIASGHAQIGDPTLADSILDRLVHNAYRSPACVTSPHCWRR